VSTTRRLLPGESEVLRLVVPERLAPGAMASYWVRLNDGPMPLASLLQCRDDNDEGRLDAFCPSVE
jgi:hypothetical protein